MNKYKLPISILGQDFISPEDIQKYCKDVVYSDEQKTILTKSLPLESVLKWCKDNSYVVISSPPTEMSLLDVFKIKSNHFNSNASEWFANKSFAYEDKTSFGWIAIKKKPVLNSIGENWYAQEKLVTGIERVPNVAEMGWFITTYFEVHGVRLFKDTGVRTSSLGFGDNHVDIGHFGDRGIHMHCYWDKESLPDLGLSVAKK